MEQSGKISLAMARVTHLKTTGITKEQDEDLLKAYLNMAPSQTLKWIESGKSPQRAGCGDPGNRAVYRRRSYSQRLLGKYRP